MHPEERYAKRALENGASGYITKGSSPEELERAIRKAHSGKKYISETFAEELAADVEGERSAAPHHRLSDREFEILLLIGSGWETREIAEKLHLNVSTVHTYKQRVMKKLGLQTTAELFQYVYTHRLIDSAAL
jgi:DNA-binding NarL/FixJ family response regulator